MTQDRGSSPIHFPNENKADFESQPTMVSLSDLNNDSKQNQNNPESPIIAIQLIPQYDSDTDHDYDEYVTNYTEFKVSHPIKKVKHPPFVVPPSTSLQKPRRDRANSKGTEPSPAQNGKTTNISNAKNKENQEMTETQWRAKNELLIQHQKENNELKKELQVINGVMDAKNRKNTQLMDEMADLLIAHQRAFDVIAILEDENQILFKQFNELQQYLKQNNSENDADHQPWKCNNNIWMVVTCLILIVVGTIFGGMEMMNDSDNVKEIGDDYNGMLMEHKNDSDGISLMNEDFAKRMDLLSGSSINYDGFYCECQDEVDDLKWNIEQLEQFQNELLVMLENEIRVGRKKKMEIAGMNEELMELRNDSLMKEEYIDKMEMTVNDGFYMYCVECAFGAKVIVIH